jgi:hypothetical protein
MQRDYQRVLLHQEENPLLVDRLPLNEAQVSPDFPIAPRGMISLEFSDTLEDPGVAFGDPEQWLPCYPTTAFFLLLYLGIR